MFVQLIRLFKDGYLRTGFLLVLQVFQEDLFQKMNLKLELRVSEAILGKDLQWQFKL